MNKIIEVQNWRYATKVFDKTKKIKDNDFQTILESFRLTPSSFWLQPWKMIIVENQELREKLVEHSWDQKQISNASHLLVLAKYNDFWDKNINSYLDKIIEIRGWSRENLIWYEEMMKWFITNLTPEKLNNWQENQIHIALWNLITICAFMWIDSCAIWWFISEKYDEILWLKEKWLSSVVLLPIGYRDEEADKYSKLKKVRFDLDEIIEFVK